MPVAVDDEVRAIAALFESTAAAKRITLVCSTEPGQPPTVMGDPLRIRQILLNLVGNAVKFTAVGGVELTAVVPDAHPDGTVLVSFIVRDTGIGMEADRQAVLFRPFAQAEQNTTRLYGGTGLGLSIVSRLIELMHGTVEVTSSPGAGSTFVVHLPLSLAPGDAVPRPRAPSRPATERVDHERIAGHVVLIVEDNAVNRDVLQCQLALIGCSGDVVADGQQALDRLATGGISLVLTVCHMPVLNGFDLTRAIRTDEQLSATHSDRMPVVAITADAMQGEGDRCLAAGMDAYLTMPVNVGRLAEVVADLLPKAPVRGTRSVDLEVLRRIVGGDEAALVDVLEIRTFSCAT